MSAAPNPAEFRRAFDWTRVGSFLQRSLGYAPPIRFAPPCRHTPQRRRLLRDRCSRDRGRSRGGICARTQSLRPLPDSGRGLLSALKRVRNVRVRCSHRLPIGACRWRGGAAVGWGEGSKRLCSSRDPSPHPTAAGLANTQESACRHGGTNRKAEHMRGPSSVRGVVAHQASLGGRVRRVMRLEVSERPWPLDWSSA